MKSWRTRIFRALNKKLQAVSEQIYKINTVFVWWTSQILLYFKRQNNKFCFYGIPNRFKNRLIFAKRIFCQKPLTTKLLVGLFWNFNSHTCLYRFRLFLNRTEIHQRYLSTIFHHRPQVRTIILLAIFSKVRIERQIHIWA